MGRFLENNNFDVFKYIFSFSKIYFFLYCYRNPTLGFDSIVDTHWKPVNGRQEYLSIDRKLTAGEFPTEERVEFWKNLEKQYSQQGI